MDGIVPGSSARPHRKAWEFAMGVMALEEGGVLHEDAFGLSVGAGHEPVLYYLTNRCRWLFATDLYGAGSFVRRESADAMLVDPDLFAPYPYRRRRLTVAYMDALDLRFEDASFDFVVSFGSIEHFGGVPGAAARAGRGGAGAEAGRRGRHQHRAARGRRPRPAGAARPASSSRRDTLRTLVASTAGLSWLGGADLDPTEDPEAPLMTSRPTSCALEAGDQHYPHVRLGVLTGDGAADLHLGGARDGWGGRVVSLPGGPRADLPAPRADLAAAADPEPARAVDGGRGGRAPGQPRQHPPPGARPAGRPRGAPGGARGPHRGGGRAPRDVQARLDWLAQTAEIERLATDEGLAAIMEQLRLMEVGSPRGPRSAARRGGLLTAMPG